MAATYYVDPTGEPTSSDDYDGTAEVWEGEGSLVGPKKTLAEVAAEAMKVASKSNPCTIIALPGYYNEGVSNPEAIGTAMTLNRVTLNSYITLRSRDGKYKTFIVGAKSDAPNADSYGCGTNATRCVSGGTVQGFTLTGARVFYQTASLGSSDGGAVVSGTAIDCIITNNVAYRGGGNYYGTNIRCYFKGNVAFNGSANMAGSSYNCLFAGEQAYQGSYYNCTFGSSSYPRQGIAYNCLVLGTGSSSNGSPEFHRCYHIKGYKSDTTLDDCVVFNSASDLKVDSSGRPTDSTSSIIDAGSATYYDNMSTAAKALDFDGNPRLLNGMVDVGCYEHNPCADFSPVLSPDGAITVTNVTSFVTGAVDRVVLCANAELKGTLELYDAAETMWSFFATVNGTGSLNVHFAESDEPGRTVTAADGTVEVKYTAAAATGIRLVYEGADGAAEVSRFSNATHVSIAAEGLSGLAISGDYTAPGDYAVAYGQTKTVTLRRANEGLAYVSGVLVNGVFHNLYDYPDGLTLTVDGSDRATAISVEAVTATPNELFVDRTNGSDSNCGLYTNLAFQSLAKAASVASANWTILALPGVYDNEVSNPEAIGTAATLNRVTLPARVTLKALGTAEETIIMGAKSDAPDADSNGCGTNAVRCLYMNADSKAIGFTLTGGRTFFSAGGGGAASGTLVGCVVSNNACHYRGGGTSSTTVYGCRFYWNYAGSGQPGPGMNVGVAYNTYFENSHPYSANSYSCTYAKNAYARGGSHYNALCLTDGGKYINGPKFYHCYFTYRPNDYSSPVLDEECVITNAAALPVDANGRPAAGSIAIDAGRMDYFERIAAEYRDKDAFGGQRVYNGAVDVGCGEYDWRGDFAKALAAKNVEVTAAGEHVATNAVAGLDVAAGQSLKLKLSLGTGGPVSFALATEDAASVSVFVDGRQLSVAEAGIVSFEAEEGEHTLEIVCSADAAATVSGFTLPMKGGILIVL